MLARDVRERLHRRAAQHAAGRVARRDDDEHLRLLCNQAAHLVDLHLIVVLLEEVILLDDRARDVRDLGIRQIHGVGHEHLVAGVERAQKRHEHTLRHARGDGDLRWGIVQPVLARQLLADRLLQFQYAGAVGIARLPGVERALARIDDVLRRAEIGLAERQRRDGNVLRGKLRALAEHHAGAGHMEVIQTVCLLKIHDNSLPFSQTSSSDSCGTYVVSSSTTRIVPISGQIHLTTRSNGIRATDEPTNRFTP